MDPNSNKDVFSSYFKSRKLFACPWDKDRCFGDHFDQTLYCVTCQESDIILHSKCEDIFNRMVDDFDTFVDKLYSN